jgi:hypothetical protein
VTPATAICNFFVFNTNLLWLIIPMSIFRPWSERHFLDRIPCETEKSLFRPASQWTVKINAAIVKMQFEVEKSARGQIASVESLAFRTRSKACGIRSGLKEIHCLGFVLDSYNDNLERPNHSCFHTQTANLDEGKL